MTDDRPRSAAQERAPAAGAAPDQPDHRVVVGLRWRDMDQLGHLNQSVYHELLEEGRAGFMSRLLASVDSDFVRTPFVLAHVELDHRAEVRREHGEIEIIVWVASVGTSSVRLGHEMRRPDGVLAASGFTVMVGWDPQKRGKRPLSERERAALRPWQSPVGG